MMDESAMRDAIKTSTIFILSFCPADLVPPVDSCIIAYPAPKMYGMLNLTAILSFLLAAAPDLCYNFRRR